jgi:subtilisin family serine protease
LPATFGSGGPDTFGYEWVDSNHEAGPSFEWVDIKATGTLVAGLRDDSVAGPLDIGFPFEFYGESYQQLYVSSNGFISFSQTYNDGCCTGQPLPVDDGIHNIIAWLWRDLYPGAGEVYYQNLNDGRFVIQFENYGEFGHNGLVTAQIILSDRGDILLQYQSLENGIEQRNYSIGIENADSTDGLQVAFNRPYLENNLAVRISNSASWLDVSPRTGTIPAGESRTVDLRYSAVEQPGEYNTFIDISHSDPNQETVHLPVAFEVVPDATAPSAVSDLTVGDVGFNEAQLSWTAVADSGISSNALANYELRYSTSEIDDQNWDAATAATGLLPPKSPGAEETFVVSELEPSTTYYFGLKATDDAGNSSVVSNVVQATTSAPPVASLSVSALGAELVEGQQSFTAFELANNGGYALNFSMSLVETEQSISVSAYGPSSLTSSQRTPRTINALPASSEYASSELIVRFKPQLQQGAEDTLRSHYGAFLVKRIAPLNMEVWKLDRNADMLNVIQSLNRDDSVLFAEPNYRLKPLSLPNDARFGDLWGLHNTGGTGGIEDSDIDALEAWAITTGSEDVVVAVIDTGVDYTHSDLVGNMWTNPGEIADNGVDDDGNGYIDDVHGYDFYSDDADPMDDVDHGTHVAGTIGAEGNNGLGVVGVNHSVSLMAVRFLGSGGGTTDGAIASILYAVDNGATILNNSWGGGMYSEALLAAVEYAHAHNVLFVAAAGNSGMDSDVAPLYPASYDVDSIISVAATDHNDDLAMFSQYGLLSVDLGAPGVSVLSAVPGEGYLSFDGTSMASPHVAGAAALLKARKPSLTHLELKQLLLDTADPVASLEGITVTGGRLNIHSALQQAGPSWAELLGEVSGSLLPGETLQLSLELDSTDLAPGEHYLELHLESNDPEVPVIVVPITLTVHPDIDAPSAIENLSVSEVTDVGATLQFTATGDDGADGQATTYDVRFSTSALTEENWGSATEVSGEPSPALSSSQEQFSISGLQANSTLWIGVRVMDNGGNVSPLSNVVEINTLNSELQVTPDSVPVTTVRQGELATVELSLSNIGDVDVEASITLDPAEQVANAYSVQYLADNDIGKGEADARVGPQVVMGRGGPDNFGYRWIDSNEPDGPVYSWTDISSTGTPVGGLYDDVTVGPFDIGFSFPFYGEAQSQFYISSNGFITFAASSADGCCSGQPLPRADWVNHVIAWLWYDLYPGTGTVHYEQVGNDLVIQFTNYGELSGSGTVDAQIVLSPSGSIQLRYKEFRNGMSTHWASVGIENADGSDGLQVAFNTDYLTNELAVQINPHWLATSHSNVTLAPTESAQVTLTIDATSLPVGEHQSNLVIRSNDAHQPERVLPIVVNVTE